MVPVLRLSLTEAPAALAPAARPGRPGPGAAYQCSEPVGGPGLVLPSESEAHWHWQAGRLLRSHVKLPGRRRCRTGGPGIRHKVTVAAGPNPMIEYY